MIQHEIFVTKDILKKLKGRIQKAELKKYVPQLEYVECLLKTYEWDLPKEIQKNIMDEITLAVNNMKKDGLE